MRKRELQSIPLKLAELKEYDNAKAERALENKTQADANAEDSSAAKGSTPIANVEPKSSKEILERINPSQPV